MSARALADRLAALSPAQRALFEQSLRKGDKEEGKPQPRPAPVPSLGAVPKRAQWSPCPLSIDQERLWFIQQLDPASPVYNIYNAIRFRGPLDLAALTAAVDEVVRRQEVLRTSFPAVDGRPVQVIAPHWDAELPVVDLRALPEAYREAEAERASEAIVRRPFILDRLPLFNFPLIRVEDEDTIQPTVFHHIIVDRLSAEIMTVELKALYHAILHGLPSPLPELPVQFADFAVWQRQRLETGGLLAEQLEWWTKHLEGASELLPLPTDRPRPPVQGPNGARRRLTLSKAHSDGLRALAQSGSATLFMAGLAVLKALLVRLSGQEKLIVGTPYDYRQGPELEPLLGFFLNQLILFTDLTGDPPFREVLARVRDTAVGAYEHSELPFAKLVEALKPARDLSYIPYTQIVFLLLPLPAHATPGIGGQGRADVDEVDMDAYWVDAGRSQFDINFALWEEQEGRLAGFIEHSTDLFDATTIHRMREQFRSLLAAVLADPGRRLWDLPLLGEAERHQLLHEWNGGIGAEPRGASLPARFAAQAARAPGSVAVVCEGESLTYRELDRRANRLARRLIERGARPGARIGLCAERGLGMVAGILGILKAGCAYVPLDPSYPRERLAFLIEDAGIPVLVAEPGAAASLPDAEAWDESRLVSLDGIDAAGEDGDPGVEIDAGWPAYVIYTSGSTGRPKGVVVTHANVIRLFTSTSHWFGFGDFGGRDVWSLFHSFAFDVSVWELWGAFLHGGKLAVVPYWVSRSPEAFHALLLREGVTVLSQTPSAFRQLVPVEGRLPELRWVVFAGEALDPRSLQPWIDRYGDDRPRLINMYGITETTVHSTFRRISREDVEAGWGSPVGVPIPDLPIHAFDRAGRPQPIGVPGELVVGGAGVATGYLGRPDLTAERFVPDLFSTEPGGRLYRSGDLARWLAAGELEYLGRIDHQVKVRGFRIELGEIESALVQHPAVREVAVLARQEGGETRLAAYVVGGEGAVPPLPPLPPIEELRSYLRDRLPEYMVPSAFVPLDALPLTAHGKLDRRALPVPGGARPDLAAAYVAPRTPAEEVLAGVWSQVLGIDEIGVRDNFFVLGGDSILSLRVLALAGQRGLQLTLQDLFRHQTIAELALAAGASRRAAAERPATSPFSLVSEADRARLPEDLEDAYPLSMLQEGMLYHLERSPDDPPYHNVDSWHLRGPFVEGPFRAAVQRVIERHPTLRTSFALTGFSEPLQLVYREAVLPIEVEDLRALDPEGQERAIDAICAREKRDLFDVSRAPQWRFHIAPRSEDEYQFTLAENHAIIDGWSFHSTLAEIFDLYIRMLDGEDPRPEPPVPLTYRDYVVLERQAVASPEAEAFWTRVLDGAPYSPLPRWSPRIPGPAGPLPWPRIRSLSVPMPGGTYRGLQSLARKAAVPIKSVLLAAHLEVLGRLSGQTDVMTGMVSNGRLEEAGGDEVRGLFLNTLPLRLDLSAGSWLDLVQAAFRAEEEMLPFRRVPYGHLQRRLGDRPLVEVVFNYVHFHVVRDMIRSGRIEVLGMRRSEGSNFKFSAHFSQDLAATEVALELEYDAHAVPAAQVEALGGLFTRVLTAMSADATACPRDLSFLSEPERHQLLNEWNDTADLSPAPFRLLTDLVEAHAALRPEAVAVALGDLSLTYAELNALANRLAHHLLSMGVTAGARVGLCMERTPDALAGILGILKAGAAYVPLDPAYPADRLAFMAEDADLSLLLTHGPTADLPFASAAPRLDLDALQDVLGTANLCLDLPSHSLAYILYTSGSTGRPKGAGCHHAGVLNFIEHAHRRKPLPPGAVNTLWTTLSFDVSVYEIFLSLREGGRLEIVPDRIRTDSRAYAEWLAEKSVASAYVAPILLPDLNDQKDLELQRILTGVEPIREPLLAALAARLPGLISLDGYGPTEATIAVAIYEVGSKPEAPPERDTPLGRPVRNTRLHLLDRDFQPVPLGVPGELHISGAGLAWGYLSRPDLTAERYLPDPFGPAGVSGGRLYRTGDLARWMTGGDLEFLGRIDHQIKIRGFRVELGEIEAALGSHPAVRECAVLARETPRGDRQLVACVSSREPEEDLAGRLQRFLRTRLPDFMVPASYVILSALPLTLTGKVDRRALLAQAVPSASAPPYVEPATDLEHLLIDLCHRLLNLPADRRIGLRDNFFDLGGHSLLATQFTVRLREEHGVDASLPLLFESADLGDLAERITERELAEVDDATLEELLADLDEGRR